MKPRKIIFTELSLGEWCFVLAIAFLLWLVSGFRLRWIIREM